MFAEFVATFKIAFEMCFIIKTKLAASIANTQLELANLKKHFHALQAINNLQKHMNCLL